MSRIILIGLLLVALAAPASAQETYPAGTDSVTIYAVACVGVTINDSTATNVSTTLTIENDSTNGPDEMVVMRFPLDDVPADKAIAKVTFHVYAATQKAMTVANSFEVSRLLADYDSTAVTYTRRNATNQWPSNDIRTATGWAVDTESGSATASIRSHAAFLANDGTPANAEYLKGDLTGMVRAWYSGLWDNDGIMIRHNFLPGDGAGISTPTIHSSKGTNPPYIKVYYTDAGSGGTTTQRVRRVGGAIPPGIHKP